MIKIVVDGRQPSSDEIRRLAADRFARQLQLVWDHCWPVVLLLCVVAAKAFAGETPWGILLPFDTSLVYVGLLFSVPGFYGAGYRRATSGLTQLLVGGCFAALTAASLIGEDVKGALVAPVAILCFGIAYFCETLRSNWPKYNLGDTIRIWLGLGILLAQWWLLYSAWQEAEGLWILAVLPPLNWALGVLRQNSRFFDGVAHLVVAIVLTALLSWWTHCSFPMAVINMCLTLCICAFAGLLGWTNRTTAPQSLPVPLTRQ